MSIAQKIKVLIVDDQVTSRLLLGDALQQLGFTQITVAGDGEQGAKIMNQQPHHLVISDFNMPKMDGFGLSPGGPVQSGNQAGSLYHADGPG
jgi:two-component system chemotaxis response regulator CheY